MDYQKRTQSIESLGDILLRHPEIGDAKSILDYLKQVVSETEFLLRTVEECDDNVEAEETYIQHMRHSKDECMIVVQHDSKIIGLCNVGLKKRLKMKHRATLGISILKDYWGYGIGSIMMDEMIRIATDLGAIRLELEVIEGNDRAIALYEKKGFRMMAEMKDAIKTKDGKLISEFVMVKHLSSS